MADQNHLGTITVLMNDLSMSSPKKSSDYKAAYNIDNIDSNLGKLSLTSSESESETLKLPKAKSDMVVDSRTKPDTVETETMLSVINGQEQAKVLTRLSPVDDHDVLSKHQHAEVLIRLSSVDEHDVLSKHQYAEVLTRLSPVDEHDVLKGAAVNDSCSVNAETTASEEQVSPEGDEASSTKQGDGTEDIFKEERALSMELEGRGPTCGVAVPRKPAQKAAWFDVNGTCDFNFQTAGNEDDDNDPPCKYRNPGRIPQEHEDMSKSPQSSNNLLSPEGLNRFSDLQGLDKQPELFSSQLKDTGLSGTNLFGDICPSFPQYDSDEFRQLKDDLIRGAEHLEVIKDEPEQHLKAFNQGLEPSLFSPSGEMAYPDTPDSVSSRKSNQTESSLANISPLLSGKLDSSDIKVMMQDLDCISMDAEDDTKVISVTDLIEGSGSNKDEKMLPIFDLPNCSPGSVSMHSPYSNHPTPGSDGLNSPADESSRDSFASSKTSGASPEPKRLSTDQLPRPDMSSLLMGENQIDSPVSSKANHTTKSQGTATQEKPKKPSKSKSKSTGRPRGRPPKVSKPPDKTLSRPLPTIAPKPMLPQVVTTGTTTLIILQNPGIISNINSANNGLASKPGGLANAPLGVAQTVVTGQSVVIHPTTQSVPDSSKKMSSVETSGKKVEVTRPDTLTTGLSDMLPSEKDKKNLKKAERIVMEIPQAKLTYQDSDRDTLLHFLSLSNRYEDLIDQLFDNSQSLFTTGIPQERYIYKALIERIHSQGILDNMINLRNKQNQTPLYLAVSTSKAELVRLLLEKGADPNICAHTRKFNGEASGFRMPLHVAASKGKSHVPVLKLLLECPHIEIDATNSERKTPLHCAVECHNPPVVDSTEITELLLKHKARVLQGPNEQTPLHTVIEKNDFNLLRFIVDLLPVADRKPVLNMKDAIGNTCLHLCAVQTKKKDASGKYFPAVVNMMRYLLLVCDVDIGIVNQKNETAKKLVCKDNELVMVAYREAENRRRNKRSQEKMREMEATRLDQLQHQMFSNMQLQPDGVNPVQRHMNPGMPNMAPYAQMLHPVQPHHLGMKGSESHSAGSYFPGGLPHTQGRPTQRKSSEATNMSCKHPQQRLPKPYRNQRNNGQQFAPGGVLPHPDIEDDRYPQNSSERGFPGQMMPEGALHQRHTGFHSQYVQNSNQFSPATSQIPPGQHPQSGNCNNGAYPQMDIPIANMATMNAMSNVTDQTSIGYSLPKPGVPDGLRQQLPYGNRTQTSTDQPLNGDKKDSTFDDLEQLLSNLKGNDCSKLENCLYTQNMDKMTGPDLKGMVWNVPFSGSEMPYEKMVNNVNRTPQSCQLVTSGKTHCLPKEPAIETTRNSFLEQLVNADCTMPNGASQKTFPEENYSDYSLNLEKQLFPDLQPSVAIATLPGMEHNQPSAACCSNNSSVIANQTHPGSKSVSTSNAMLQAAHAHPCAQPRPKRNNMSGMTSFSQALQPQGIFNFQSDRPLMEEENNGALGNNPTVPLHHCHDFDVPHFETQTAMKTKPGLPVPNGSMENTQYRMDQNSWMQNNLQTVQNM